MKVLLINGSPRGEGNTYIALSEVAKTLEAEGVEAEIVSIGTKAVRGCIACGKCAELGRCVFNDTLYNNVREKLETADAIVVGSPVYYAGPTARSAPCSTGSSIRLRRCCATSLRPLSPCAAAEGRARRSTGLTSIS